MEGFDAPALLTPATLTAGLTEAIVAQRPVLVAGGEPKPVVILLDIEVRSIGA